jgi:hypothetical protein
VFDCVGNKMPNIIVYHGIASDVMSNCFSEYMFYINLLFIYKQVYDVDLHIRNDRDNKIVGDPSTM